MYTIMHTATREETWMFYTKEEAQHFYDKTMSARERKAFHIQKLSRDHEAVMEDTWPEYESVMEMEKWQ